MNCEIATSEIYWALCISISLHQHMTACPRFVPQVSCHMQTSLFSPFQLTSPFLHTGQYAALHDVFCLCHTPAGVCICPFICTEIGQTYPSSFIPRVPTTLRNLKSAFLKTLKCCYTAVVPWGRSASHTGWNEEQSRGHQVDLVCCYCMQDTSPFVLLA